MHAHAAVRPTHSCRCRNAHIRAHMSGQCADTVSTFPPYDGMLLYILNSILYYVEDERVYSNELDRQTPSEPFLVYNGRVKYKLEQVNV